MVQRPTRPERETSRSTMGSSIRSGASSRMSGLRQPTTVRQSTTGRLVRTRALPGAGASTGGMDRSSRATSPAESVMSMSSTATGTKRKDRDYEAGAAPTPSSSLGGTNINVVVRCRGRNAREVKENSTVVVNTDGVKGKLVELSMGASAISDKTYSFDRVFSPAADQSMVYDDTVKPILDDVGSLPWHCPPWLPLE